MLPGGAAAAAAAAVAAPARLPAPSGFSMMDRPRPSGLPGSGQLRIPTPQELERMRRMRQQQQQQQRQRHAPPPAPQRRQQPGAPQRRRPQPDEEEDDSDSDDEEQPQRAQQPGLPPRHAAQQPQSAAAAAAAAARGRLAPQRQGPPQRIARPPARGGRDDVFSPLADSCALEDAWRPQVLLLYDLGLRAPDFQRLIDSRPEIFQMGIVTMRRKLKFFQDTIGLSNAELTKVIAKFPRILEYKSERTIRPRLDFLQRCGVAQDELAKVFVRAPMALELRVKDTLEPRAAFLRSVLSLSSGALGKLIVRHPQVLTCTEDMMQQRVVFLQEQGLSKAELGRAVLAHPQVLHYKIDSMQERVAFLRRIGLDSGQVAACISRFPQVFSLNVEANLEPKWRYLCDYMRGTPAECVSTLCSYPAYFSLSLTNRVVPRHRFFLFKQAQTSVASGGGKSAGSSRKRAGGTSKSAAPGSTAAFPTNLLKCSDVQFCTQLGATPAEYESFRQALFGDAAPPPAAGA